MYQGESNLGGGNVANPALPTREAPLDTHGFFKSLAFKEVSKKIVVLKIPHRDS
jgi:hypothetical protein